MLSPHLVIDAVELGLGIGGPQRIQPAQALLVADQALLHELQVGIFVLLNHVALLARALHAFMRFFELTLRGGELRFRLFDCVTGVHNSARARSQDDAQDQQGPAEGGEVLER